MAHTQESLVEIWARAKNVIVAVDGSATSDAAIDWTVSNIMGKDDTLHLVHVFQPLLPALAEYLPGEEEAQHIEKGAKALLQEAAARCLGEEPALHVKQHLMCGDPRNAICDLADDIKADLIVVGSRGKGLLARALLGSVSSYLAHHCTAPVVIIRKPAEETKERKYDGESLTAIWARGKNIVVCADGSSFGDAAIDWAIASLLRQEDTLHLVHVYQPPQTIVDESVTYVPSDEELSKAKANAEAILNATAKRCFGEEPALKVKTHLLEGDPRFAICDFGDAINADAVVVGTSGRGPVAEGLLGSVSMHLAHHCQHPLAIIHKPKA